MRPMAVVFLFLMAFLGLACGEVNSTATGIVESTSTQVPRIIASTGIFTPTHIPSVSNSKFSTLTITSNQGISSARTSTALGHVASGNLSVSLTHFNNTATLSSSSGLPMLPTSTELTTVSAGTSLQTSSSVPSSTSTEIITVTPTGNLPTLPLSTGAGVAPTTTVLVSSGTLTKSGPPRLFALMALFVRKVASISRTFYSPSCPTNVVCETIVLHPTTTVTHQDSAGCEEAILGCESTGAGDQAHVPGLISLLGKLALVVQPRSINIKSINATTTVFATKSSTVTKTISLSLANQTLTTSLSETNPCTGSAASANATSLASGFYGGISSIVNGTCSNLDNNQSASSSSTSTSSGANYNGPSGIVAPAQDPSPGSGEPPNTTSSETAPSTPSSTGFAQGNEPAAITTAVWVFMVAFAAFVL